MVSLAHSLYARLAEVKDCINKIATFSLIVETTGEKEIRPWRQKSSSVNTVMMDFFFLFYLYFYFGVAIKSFKKICTGHIWLHRWSCVPVCAQLRRAQALSSQALEEAFRLGL